MNDDKIQESIEILLDWARKNNCEDVLSPFIILYNIKSNNYERTSTTH